MIGSSFLGDQKILDDKLIKLNENREQTKERAT